MRNALARAGSWLVVGLCLAFGSACAGGGEGATPADSGPGEDAGSDVEADADVGEEDVPEGDVPDQDVPEPDVPEATAVAPGFGLSAGGATLESESYRLRVVVGGPSPAAKTSNTKFNARIGVGTPQVQE